MANSIVFTENSIVSTYDTAGSYTWTKNRSTTQVTVLAWGGGGGGGSGQREATSSCGGGGGGAGSVFMYTFPSYFFGSTETVVVGAGGAGGAAQTSNSSNGNNGSNGTNSSVGSLTTANTWIDGQGSPATHYQKGRGGNVTIVDYETGEAGLIFVGGPLLYQLPAPNSGDLVYHAWYAPSNTSAGYNGKTPYDTGGSTGIIIAATSGGEGAGANSSTERTGGSGGNLVNQNKGTTVLAGGAGGVESGTINGTAGADRVTSGGFCTGGSGGGGGGGQYSGAAAGTGGKGGFPGGGGGGGGGSLNGTNSGAGGAGGDGLVIIIELC